MSKVRGKLTLFFDSTCPLCVSEMRTLKSLDSTNQLIFENIYSDDFCDRFPDISQVNAANTFHGRYDNGDMVFGLDVSVRAWNIVGKNKWLRILRAPGFRVVSDIAYRFFARYRSSISLLLTGKRHCDSCEIKNFPLDEPRQKVR